ncbi:hypothetical protein ACWZHB_27900 [Nocardia sp. FBN12]|uniref:hypothetical protein n=1 Tax=Nocardia sp. FBN12 TaxID=3419766 RepID=UPI003D005C9D
MGKRPGVLYNPMVFVYWAVSVIGAALYVSWTLRVATFVAPSLTDESVGYVFGVLGGLLFALITWPFVLMLVWWGRRAYLRKVAVPVRATVTEAGHRVTHSSNNPFATHRVRLKVMFTHPGTGVEHWMKKEYAMFEFRRSTAKELLHRFPEGAELPMLVRGRAAGFDLALRPQWVDLW